MASYEQKPNKKQQELLNDFAQKALEAFRADLPEVYAELVKRHEGAAVAAGIFGMGMTVFQVRNGQVEVNPKARKGALIGRGATYPETIAALATGKLTPLDAYHKGDLVVQAARSESLHEGYNQMAKHSDAVLRSARLQKVFADFCKAAEIDA